MTHKSLRKNEPTNKLVPRLRNTSIVPNLSYKGGNVGIVSTYEVQLDHSWDKNMSSTYTSTAVLWFPRSL